MRRSVLLLSAFVAGLAAAPAAVPGVLLPETPVVTSSRNDYSPSAAFHASGDELIGFSRNRPNRPTVYDALLWRTGPSGRQQIKLNQRGLGFTGGIQPPLVVYQTIAGADSDIRYYNVDLGTRGSPGPQVNTRQWEYAPSISAEWLVFTRDGPRYESRVILSNRATRGQRVLDRTTKRSVFMYTGQVAGDSVVWTRCGKSCNVFLYSISGRVRERLPKPAGRLNGQQYAAAVLPSGIVYLARSGRACGSSARILRFHGPSDPTNGTLVARLPKGRDLVNAYVRENADGTADLFYDRVRCGRRPTWDVYKIHDPDPTAPPPARGLSESRVSASSSTRGRASASGMNWLRNQPGSRSR